MCAVCGPSRTRGRGCKMKPRPVRIEGDLAFVPLTRGYEAIIDLTDVPLVAAKNWCAVVCRRSVYAQRGHVVAGKWTTIALHRAILGSDQSLHIDHINGDGLDNRRANLRFASPKENSWNQRLPVNNSSGFKGVSWYARARKWTAQIRVDGKHKCLGYFREAEAAHAAYCQAAEKYFGEYARFK